MIVRSLIQPDLWPARSSDTVESAQELMDDAETHQLPVVDDGGRLVGLLTSTQLDDAFADDMVDTLPAGPAVSVDPGTHVFDAARLMVVHQLSMLPVLDEAGLYLGLVRRSDLFDQLGRLLGVMDEGATVVVEMDARDYTVGRLTHAIEQSDVRILSLSAEISELVGGMARITLKLNTTDTARVRHMLEHYGYSVVGTFNEHMSEEDLQLRVQEFLRYLEV